MTDLLSKPDLLGGKGATARLACWLRQEAGVAVADPAAIAVEVPAGGWSNETAILRVGERRPVLRTVPSRLSMFPTYDLGREVAVLAALGRCDRPPVPRLLGHDPEGRVLGRPFFAMDFVAGQVPSDSKPGYAEAGWLAEAPLAAQGRFWADFVDCLAAVHRCDWRGEGLSVLAPPAGRSSLDAQLDWLEGLYAWSAAPQPEIDAGLAAVRAARPRAPGPDRLLWGDARPANVLVADFHVAALLDWEMAAIGPAEMDVAWLLEMHRLRTAGAGIVAPAGFPDEEGIVSLYETASGRRLQDLTWYRLFAAVKVAVLMYRHLVVAIDRDMLTPGHRLLRENVATRRIAALLAAQDRRQNEAIPR
ncbi:phosphotransferase family protein [Marinibaculum pumilum]|uniref:Phosphotransferase family protein n=1 Tax=Marinibaculum pumilum TaxID=1766165 RepID=A0ABV7L5T0_9PROT